MDALRWGRQPACWPAGQAAGRESGVILVTAASRAQGLWRACMRLRSDFLAAAVAYHHFRSKARARSARPCQRASSGCRRRRAAGRGASAGPTVRALLRHIFMRRLCACRGRRPVSLRRAHAVTLTGRARTCAAGKQSRDIATRRG